MINNYVVNIDDSNYSLKKLLLHIGDINIFNKKYILNKQNDKFDAIEQFVYDIAIYHANNLNIINKYFIEFCFIDSSKECIKEKYADNNVPILSCITYFSTGDEPIIISSLTQEQYLYKDVDSDNIKIYFSFPKELKQITYDGNLHKVYNGSGNCLVVNLFENKSSNHNSYISNNDDASKLIFNINKSNERTKHLSFEKAHDYDFFENLLYEKNGKSSTQLLELIKKNPDYFKFDNFLFTNEKAEDSSVEEIIKDKNINNLSEEKYLQKYVKENFFDKKICNWLKNEYDNHLLKNNITDAPIDNISTIFSFIIESSIKIIELIEEFYSIDNYNFNIKDIFVIKENYCKAYDDTIAVNIVLNKPTLSENNYLHFEDGVKIKAEIGNMIVRKGATKCKTNKDTYILVILINIYKK